jgi:hypothetical protein
MRKPIALATTAVFLLSLGCDRTSSGTTSPSSSSDANVLSEKHHSDHGFEMNVLVTRGSDDVVVSRANATDATTGDAAEIRTDGQTITWTGTIGGEPVSGSSTASDLLEPDLTTPACLHPVAALICVGAAAALLAGCAFGFSCEGGGPTNPPEGGGGVPGGGEGDEEPEDEEDTGD